MENGPTGNGPGNPAYRAVRRAARAAIVAAGVAGVAWGAGEGWVARTAVPPLSPATSPVIAAADGTLLRAYAVEDGIWRLPVTAVDPGLVAQLVAWEDRRFWRHGGVDLVALLRAAGQAMAAGRIVSGGSTLTMQVARLLERGPTGTLAGKLRQIRVALALERRLSKREILALYLHLAPYGGALEGVRAASLSLFGAEPRRLSPAEAALLVALPQAPAARRPDRNPAAARAARDRVFARAQSAGILDAATAATARAAPVPTRRLPFPRLAAHLADRLHAADPTAGVIRTTLDAPLQQRLEGLLAERVAGTPGLSAALIVADHRTGAVLAEIGSPDLLDAGRRGAVDMTRAVRSPGSLLKPLIYGLAFDAGLAHPETRIDDRPMRFGSYAPVNFDRAWHGTLTVRQALQRSLNVPAIAVLDAVGPAQLLGALRRGGAAPRLPPGGAPGLAIGLGGLGLSLAELTGVYAAIARGGIAVALSPLPGPPHPGGVVLSPGAAWQVVDILRGVPPPASAPAARLAYKTGTSYGHRDAWAIGFDGRHVIGVWLGRADAQAMPGVLGGELAAPVLFAAHARLKTAADPLPPAPPEVLTVGGDALPPPLRRFGVDGDPAAPVIAFPPDGATLALAPPDGVVLRVTQGTPPFTWLADGAPVPAEPHAREALWTPAGRGFARIAVIDAAGRAARVGVVVAGP